LARRLGPEHWPSVASNWRTSSSTWSTRCGHSASH
jgi:hypothetical protein